MSQAQCNQVLTLAGKFPFCSSETLASSSLLTFWSFFSATFINSLAVQMDGSTILQDQTNSLAVQMDGSTILQDQTYSTTNYSRIWCNSQHKNQTVHNANVSNQTSTLKSGSFWKPRDWIQQRLAFVSDNLWASPKPAADEVANIALEFLIMYLHLWRRWESLDVFYGMQSSIT